MNINSISPFLQDNYAPIQKESYFENIATIIGEIPKELNGVFYRNGPDPQFPDNNKNWFEGDGMVHMFSISNGKISYRNRWIMTEIFKLERQAGKILFKDFSNLSDPITQDPTILKSRTTANTNIIHYGKCRKK